jgi:prevent-host-death family protein
MKYTVHQAKTHFSHLLRQVEEGEEVIIARGSKTVARIIPEKGAKRPKRILGAFEGQGWAAPDAFDPATDDELREWGLL